MRDNERVIAALSKAVETNQNINIGQFIRYVASIDDLAYMSDDEFASLLEYYLLGYSMSCDFNARDINYLDIDYEAECYFFNKQNEQIAYDKFCERMKDKMLVNIYREVTLYEFLSNFSDGETYKDVVPSYPVALYQNIFWESFPIAYRHMNCYVVGKYKYDNSKHIALHTYSCKLPDPAELFVKSSLYLDVSNFVKEYGLEIKEPIYATELFEDYLVLVIDWMESPRFTDYTNHIMYGIHVFQNPHLIEVLTPEQSAKRFHEGFQQSSIIYSDWGDLLFDDGTCIIK